MPLALTARFTFNPKGILNARWIHDMAHILVAARVSVLKKSAAQTPPSDAPRPR